MLTFSSQFNVAVAQTQTHTLQQTPTHLTGSSNRLKENVGTYKWRVTLTPAATETVTVTCTVPSPMYISDNDKLTPGTTSDSNRDFTEVTQTLTFNPGDTEKTCDIPIINDSLDEPFEYSQATFEKTAGPASVAFQGNRNSVNGAITVEDDDAAPYVQFEIPNRRVLGRDGEEDTVDESVGSNASPNNRYEFVVELSSASGRVGSCDLLTYSPIRLQCNQLGPNANLRVSHEVHVEFAAITDTSKVANPATEGTDYRIVEPAGGVKRLIFAEGETTKKIVVEIIDDSDNELDEAIAFELKNPRNLRLGPQRLREFALRIQDNDYPQISVTPSAVDESAGTATFLIEQNGMSSLNGVLIEANCGEVVNNACAPYTDPAGPEFTATPGTDFMIPATNPNPPVFTFDANDRIEYSLLIADDSTDENAESFTIDVYRESLFNNLGQHFGSEVTIRADSTDAPPTVSLDIDGNVSENLSGGMAEFTVFLSEPSGKEVTVGYATEVGTATAGQDYESSQGILTFAPGEDEKNIEIAITNDAIDEDAETFAIVLLDDANLSNATLARARQTVTILEDSNDAAPNATIATEARVEEGDTHVVSVSIEGPNERASRTWDYQTITGDTQTAQAGVDYESASGILTMAKGETEASFPIRILEDNLTELDETFSIALVDDAAQLTTIVVTIALDDEAVTLTLPDGTTAEDGRVSVDEGSGQIEFQIDLALDGPASGRSATFDVSVEDGTAKAGEDYVAPSANATTLTVAEGGTAQTYEIMILEDENSEGGEYFNIVLQGTSGTTGRQVFRVDIGDNDGPDPILREIGRHVVARTEALIENQPRLIPMLRDSVAEDGAEFSLRLTDDGVGAAGGGFMGETLWGATTLSRAVDGSGEHMHLLATLGAHARMSERLHLGGMLQFDRADTKPGGDAVSGEIRGSGWMAGPYFAMRDASNPLFFEGRLLYGRATNDVNALVIGSGSDPRNASLDSERWLAQARVEGTYRFDGGARLIPLADLSHARDVMGSFVDGDGDSVAGQTIAIGKLQIGAELEIPLETARGDLRVRPGLRFVISDSTGGAFAGEENGEKGLRSRGRIDFGIDYRLDGNVVLGFESFYSGLGRKELESYGAGLDLRVDF